MAALLRIANSDGPKLPLAVRTLDPEAEVVPFKTPDRRRVLVVKGIGGLSADNLRAFFSQFGLLHRVVVIDGESFALVIFYSERVAASACNNADNCPFMLHMLEVHMAENTDYKPCPLSVKSSVALLNHYCGVSGWSQTNLTSRWFRYAWYKEDGSVATVPANDEAMGVRVSIRLVFPKDGLNVEGVGFAKVPQTATSAKAGDYKPDVDLTVEAGGYSNTRTCVGGPGMALKTALAGARQNACAQIELVLRRYGQDAYVRLALSE